MKMKVQAMISAGLVAAMMNPLAYADKQKPEQKFCNALEEFTVDLSKLDQIGTTSTVGELRAAADRVSKDADNVEKSAGKIKSPAAKQFAESAKQLRTEVKGLQANMTIDQAKSRISDDVENVRRSGQALATEAGCPSATPTMPQKESQPKGDTHPQQDSGGMDDQPK